MFELVFLGTSASAPSVQRGLSSAIVMHNEHRFMIDCGEGTQRQLLRSGLGFRRLDKILLTHGHLDHILGLGGLASTLGRWEALEELHGLGFQTIGLDSDGPDILEATFAGERIALVLGAEGKGLRQKTRETVTARARLDLPGPIRSLNVSNATAVALYVAARRSAGDTQTS